VPDTHVDNTWLQLKLLFTPIPGLFCQRLLHVEKNLWQWLVQDSFTGPSCHPSDDMEALLKDCGKTWLFNLNDTYVNGGL